jgi:predicted acyltransferase
MAVENPASNSHLPNTAFHVDQPVERVVAIDALRGFDMFWIAGGQELVLATVAIFKSPVPIWLNDQLEHRSWEGFSAWDLIMPLFLFIVGTAMPFSFSRRLEQGATKSQLYAKIICRTIILFILGMVVQGNLLDFKLSTLHVYANTLQAIAAGYLIAGIVMLNVGVIGQFIFTVLMLVGYWALLIPKLSVTRKLVTCLPLGLQSAGVLKPRLNVAMAVDEFVLGRFRDGTDYTWVLSSMTFAASVLLGVFGGHVLRSRLNPWARVGALTALGLLCLATGWIWAEWLHFPIIKHIWTSSMTLWAAGWSYLLLAFFYLFIDVLGLRRWAFPFVVTGANALTIYVAWHLLPFEDVAKHLTGGLAAHLGPFGGFIITLTAVLLWWFVLYDLYRRRVFLRI